MHRKWLTNKLNAFRPRNEAESNHLAKLKDFIRLNEFCFNSDHPPTRGLESSDQAGHVTGSAWLLSPDRRKTLLTYHRKLGKWLQLGGHSDNHPNVLETALREACEESGIRSIQALHEDVFDIDVHLVPENHNRPAHIHYDVRFVLVSPHLNFELSEESLELRWMSAEEVLKFNPDESITRMCQKWTALN